MKKTKKYIAWFDEIGKKDIPLVGGKGANLGEMVQAGIPVPFGFVVTVQAYYDFVKKSDLNTKIKHFLDLMDIRDPKSLQQTAKNIQKLILNTKIPKNISHEVMLSYLDLTKRSLETKSLAEKLASLVKEPFVAVRSSATAEDLPTASFAGQQETFLNVKGEANLLKKVHQAWASLFTARAIFYREENNFDHFKVGIAVPVQLMVNSESSGVMFTIDPVSNDKRKIIVEAIYGLGELIVQGAVTPDHYELNKSNLQILAKKIGKQEKEMIKRGKKNLEKKLVSKRAGKQKIDDDTIKKIAKLGKKLEKHYYFPQDIEWAVENGNVFIVQTRPVTTVGKEKKDEQLQKQVDEKLKSTHKLVAKGDGASPGISWGPVKIIYKASEIHKVLQGDILVTNQTNPDFVPAMKKAVAIVTEKGGRTSHAAIVSRELGIPAVVGVSKITKKLRPGDVITVHGVKGEIYKGAFTEGQKEIQALAEKKTKQLKTLKTATKVYVNLATPTRVREVAKMGADGVGLLRAEFMIADVGTHPKKLIKDKKEKVFITKLASDLVQFCESFNPRPVVYRATDFKSNEYRNLIGGKEFEPVEANPMMGYRGAFRYISDPDVFNLELETIKLVRNKYGFKNLWLMLPFVRTVQELIDVKKIISKSGLSRSSSFKLWMMVEIPSNAILIDQFCQVGLDGVSIGSNDLTMLVLGTDRDNTDVAKEFNEKDDAVLWALERVITTCSKHKVTSSICGQAPSDSPELVEKLVNWGITSISVNSDALNRTRETIYEIEKGMRKK